MKFPSQLRSLCLIGTLLLAPDALLRAQYTNGQSASTVLGQSSFTSTTTATTQSGFTMSTATPVPTGGIAVDNISGKVFVVDTVNNRILRFSSASAYASGSAAEAVIGQSSFTTSTAATTQTGLSNPVGATVDSSGTLWVADQGNRRVLAFTNAASASSGAAASLVLGQPNFTTSTAGTNQYTMSGPTAVAVNASGTLFVMDRGNNRVLRFTNAASDSNGAFADGLFGQSNYLANSTGTTQSTFGSLPWGVAVDSSNNLWVADTANNRVLCFTSASTVSTLGPNASIVLGQSDFTTGTAGATSATSIHTPVQLTLDTLNRLYVSDFANNRILVFEPSTLSNGAAASFVLGQSDFTSSSAANPPTASSLKSPQGLSYSSAGYLWVADAGNNRALNFALTAGRPMLSVPASAKVRQGQTKHMTVTLTGTQASDEYTIQVSVPKGTTNKASVQFYINGVNETSVLKNGGYQTSEILANGQLPITVQIKARATAVGTLKFNVTAASVTNSSATASVSSTIKVVVPQ
ncbi:MAG TPA: NHL repeat-containing protein [Chthoniobacterales bacterium]